MANAYKCGKCGRIEPAAAAGENETPGACSVCSGGRVFTPEGFVFDPSNWEPLDLSADELVEVGHVAPEE